MAAGSTPALSAMVSSPPLATSQPMPSSAKSRATAVQAKAFEAKWMAKSSVWAAKAALKARARARRSSSETTYAGVPNSRASSSASQPPSCRRPRSSRVEPSG